MPKLPRQNRIGKPPPKGLINYTAHYLAEILTELHNYQDYPCVYPWDRQAQPYYPPAIKPRLSGKLKFVQRSSDNTWVVVEEIPNGADTNSFEDATELMKRLKRLEESVFKRRQNLVTVPRPVTAKPIKRGGTEM